MTIRYLYGAPTINAEVFWENKVIINEWKIQYNSTLDVFFSPFNPYRILCPKKYLWASGASINELRSNFDEIRNWSYGFAIKDRDIYNVLEDADKDELQLIIDILRKKFSCAISKNCTDIAAIVDEIQKMGGDSIVNQIRQTGVKYSVIVEDVATLVKVKINKKDSIEEQENAIVEYLFREAEAKMSKEDKAKFYEEINRHHKQQKVNSFKDIIGNKVIFRLLKVVIIRMILKELLTKLSISYAAKFASTRGFSVLLGPVGLAAGTLWTLFDLTGPAYSVTVPSVLIVALIRERLNDNKAEENARDILNFQVEIQCKYLELFQNSLFKVQKKACIMFTEELFMMQQQEKQLLISSLQIVKIQLPQDFCKLNTGNGSTFCSKSCSFSYRFHIGYFSFKKA